VGVGATADSSGSTLAITGPYGRVDPLGRSAGAPKKTRAPANG
jgi:hypothetical protein